MSEHQLVSRILAIRLARLGDVTLLLPSLHLLRTAFPDARLTLLTGLPYEPLARLCPWVDDVITIDRLGMRDGPRRQALKDVLALVRALRTARFDLVVDFHGFRETNLMAWVSRGRRRIGIKRTGGAYLPFCFNLDPVAPDERLHAADKFQQVVRSVPGLDNLVVDPGPSLRIPEIPRAASPTIAMYVGASVPSRRWPADRFAALAAHVLDNWGATVVVVSGLTRPEQEAAASVAARGGPGGRVRVVQAPGIPEMVRTIAASDILVSNDSGPMHIGSALGVPTLGIFSESPPHHYRPVGRDDRYIHRARVQDVEVDAVVRILEEMRGDHRERARRS